MFGQKFFPYSTLQELNLDWILTKVKNILRFVPDDGYVGQILRRTKDGAEWSDEQGGGGAVNSVNGKTGTVVLTASDVGALPDSYIAPVTSVNTKTGAVVLDKTDIGLGNVANVAQYSASNPPPYPVTSVNTKTGEVVLDKTDVGLGNVANVAQYSASNPPPYPVTSVNGQTGDVTVSAGISVTETGTTSDGYNTWNYRKWSNGDIDVWLNTKTFNYHGSAEGPYNGMYRKIEPRTLTILTDILWVTANGVNSCMFIAGAFINSTNTISIHAQGVSNAPTTTSASIYIKGKWN